MNLRVRRWSRLIASSRINDVIKQDGGNRRRSRIIVLLKLGDDQQRRDFRLHRHIAGDEDYRSVLAQGARKCKRESREKRGPHHRENHSREYLPSIRAQAGGGFFELLVGFRQHRLNAANHERQADKHQRDDDAQGSERDLDAEGRQIAPEPAVFRVETGQRDAGYGGGKGEGQVDQRVGQRLARELVSHQHPSHQESDHDADQSGYQRGAKTQAIRGNHVGRGDHLPDVLPARGDRFEKHRAQWDEHDETQIKNGVTERGPEARQDARTPEIKPGQRLRSRRVDFVEHAAVVEVTLLRLLPSAEEFVDGEKLELRKAIRVLGRDLFQARTIVILRADLLALLGVKEFEIRFGDFAWSHVWRRLYRPRSPAAPPEC